MIPPVINNAELKMRKRKSTGVSKAEQMSWEKHKSYKNKNTGRRRLLKDRNQRHDQQKEHVWCMIWKENWKTMSWRRGSDFRKEKGKRGKGVHENEERRKFIATNSHIPVNYWFYPCFTARKGGSVGTAPSVMQPPADRPYSPKQHSSPSPLFYINLVWMEYRQPVF